MTFVSSRRGSFYWKVGKPYVSVTNVLKIIDKPQLRYWYGNMIYLAMCKDPNMNEREAMNAPWVQSGKAAERGSSVHAMIEGYKNGTLKGVKPGTEGYISAFLDFMKEIKPEFLEQEKTVISNEYRYAGTLDAYVNMLDKKCVIDFKTNKDGNIYDEVHLQLSAYIQAMREVGEDVETGYAVALSPEGKYSYKEVQYNFDVFNHALELWKWQNSKLLEKVGFYE